MQSMTGFGQASWQSGARRITVEVRGVNQRYLDVRFALPREYQRFEEELRPLVSAVAQRGKIDISVTRTGTGGRGYGVELNEDLARQLVDGWRRLQKRLSLPGEIDVSFLTARPELIRVVEDRGPIPDDLPRVRRLLTSALRTFVRVRQREGTALGRDMKARVAHLRRIERSLRGRAAGLARRLHERLVERVGGLLDRAQINEERLVQETALLAERADVTEELVRFDTHLKRLGELLRGKGSVGKPIDFLLQELHREVNTIASKSGDLEITDLTLDARAEIEKLREQVQNVE